MIRKLVFGVCILLVASGLYAASKETERLENSGVVMEEIMNTPENIPQEVLEKAECVIVFPSLLKVAIGIGGSYGRGAMSCRTGAGFKGPWGAPAMYALEGGSFGFQLGGQATDLVLLVMNDRGAQSILSSKVKLGADASAAAGPKGRDASADTDASLRRRSLVTRVRVDYLPVYPSRVLPFAQTTMPTRKSTAEKSQQSKLYWAMPLWFLRQAATSLTSCRKVHRGMNRNN